MIKIQFLTRSRFIISIWSYVFALVSCKYSGEGIDETNSVKNSDFVIAAYIWPSCHHDERFGEMLWPEGAGEWEVIKKGTPRFEGHYQPKEPLWGYEMDDDPEVMEKWIETAVDFGINTFIFDWYWFDEGPFLESSLNNGFLKAANREKMQFYLMWANHDVKQNYWNVHKFKDEDSLLWDGAVDERNFKIVAHRIIENYFKQPNYFRINGKPVLSIFSLQNLLEGLGGIENTKSSINYFREKTREAGFPDLHLQLVVYGGPSKKRIDDLEYLGINSITQYNWGWMKEQDYIKWASMAIDTRDQWKEHLSIPFFPNVSIGWDDTPRFPDKGKADIVLYNATPENFGKYFAEAMNFAKSDSQQPKIITIFSWNEWIEGGYLLPDKNFGFRYLEEVEKTVKNY